MPSENTPRVIEFFDASVFLGMNSDDEMARVACKNFFASRMDRSLSTSLEQVGFCDNVIWRYARELQDVYYPFMDLLHSIVAIQRRPYSDEQLHRAQHDEDLTGLPASDRLLCSQVHTSGGRLYTLRPHLIRHLQIAASPPPTGHELTFPPPAEALYRASLALRVPLSELRE
ncbi:DUF6190 family protein [Paraburkholderia aspalathi]|uniref:PIN domain-containing protein n=1 Tax=Paraburkholderia aspalathi TaxID=1324617 RepID=A0A1I7ACT3_9BURK|nr:DUF6190 family protein [Paraburkholderia aspalathi]SFT72749.1 hypothetical protein SAMN05192563_1003274 [Paraburkholderia aspalathi]